MTQSEIEIKDGTGLEVLEALNEAFKTLATNFQGSSEPTETYPSMLWIDTSGVNPIKKQRNPENTAWITLGKIIDGGFYSEDRALITTETITLGTNWLGNSSPYTQKIALPGVLETDTPIITILPPTDYAEAESVLEEYGKIYRVDTQDGYLEFYAYKKTDTNLNLQVKNIR